MHVRLTTFFVALFLVGAGVLAQEDLRPLIFEVEDGYATWDPRTRKFRVLIPEFTRHVSYPVWNAKGDLAAFVAFNGNVRSIMTVDATGERSLIGVAESQFVHELTWSPSGKHFAYEVQSRTVGEGWVNLMDMKGNVRKLTADGAHDSGPWWMSDGKRLLVAATKKQEVIEGGVIFVQREQEVEIVDVTNGKRTAVTDGFREHIYNLSCSPDDRWVAIKCDGGLHVVEATGGKVRRVAKHISNSHPARWSPSGQWMLVDRRFPDARKNADGEVVPKKQDELLLIDIAGNARKLHTTAGHYYDYDWSPDGKWVAAVSDDLKVVLVDVRSGEVQDLEGGPDHWSCLRWASQR